MRASTGSATSCGLGSIDISPAEANQWVNRTMALTVLPIRLNEKGQESAEKIVSRKSHIYPPLAHYLVCQLRLVNQNGVILPQIGMVRSE